MNGIDIEYSSKIIYSYFIILNNKTGFIAYDLKYLFFDVTNFYKIALFDNPIVLRNYAKRENISIINNYAKL